MGEAESQIHLRQTFHFDAGRSEFNDSNEMCWQNQSNRSDVMKKYLVYMELPKIRVGDYRKSSCVSGNVIRFHFLLRIARDERNTVLRLLPIRAYKAPVVNFAVIHRPFLDDEDAKGPIPKSPGVRSPLIRYADPDASLPDSRTDDIADDFRSDKSMVSSGTDHTKMDSDGGETEEPADKNPEKRASQSSEVEEVAEESTMKPQTQTDESTRQPSSRVPEKIPERRSSQTSTGEQQKREAETSTRRASQTSTDEQKFEVETPTRRASQTSTGELQKREVEVSTRRVSQTRTGEQETREVEVSTRRVSQISTGEQQIREVEVSTRRVSQTRTGEQETREVEVSTRRVSQISTGKQQEVEVETPTRRASQTSTGEQQNREVEVSTRRASQTSTGEQQNREVEVSTRRASQTSTGEQQKRDAETSTRRASQTSTGEQQKRDAETSTRRASQTSTGEQQKREVEVSTRRASQTSTGEQQKREVEVSTRRASQTSTDEQKFEVETPTRRASQTSTDEQQKREVETSMRKSSRTSFDVAQETGLDLRRPSDVKSDELSKKSDHGPQNAQDSSQERLSEKPHSDEEVNLPETQAKSPQEKPRRKSLAGKDDVDPHPGLEMESPTPHEDISPATTRILSDDNATATTRTDATGRQRPRRPKKYFVYCEIPKVLIGDYRNSSVICSEIIHAHFLVKIARDEANNQPRLRPIKRYHRPRVNFAVIHRSLLVDDEAIGPIPRSPNVRSPMIKEGKNDEEDLSSDNVMHATMGFCYGRLPRSKYELVTQWSLVCGDVGGPPLPELVLSKADEA